MMAMQYSVALPADYDMEIVARRIRDKGHLMNGFPGLGFKVFLMARKTGGPCPSITNLYAPFYLWRRAEGLSDFLSGPGFATLSADFGRPSVSTWAVWHAEMGAGIGRARCAERQMRLIGPGTDLASLRSEEVRAAEDAHTSGALAAISAFDPCNWTMMRLCLWPAPVTASTADAQLYEVGHVAEG